jgi:hypothetical protein
LYLKRAYTKIPMKKNRFLIIVFILIFIQQVNLCQNIPFRHIDLWGLSDLNGTVVLEPKYDSIEFINPQDFKAKVWKEHRLGMIDGNGREIVPPIYEDVIDNNSYIIVANNKSTGIYSLQGQIILPVQYSNIEPIPYNFLIITKNNKKGIGRFANNNVAIKKLPIYDEILLIQPGNIFECKTRGVKQYFDTLFRPVKMGKKVDVFIDFSEADNIIISEDYTIREQKYPNSNIQNKDTVLIRDSTYFKVIYERKNGLWGVRKCNGTILVPYKYEDLNLNSSNLHDFYSMCHQLYVLKYYGKWGMIGHKNQDARNYVDTTTYNLIDFRYDSIYCGEKCSFYFLKSEGKTGIVAANNFDQIIYPKYLYIRKIYHKVQNKSIFLVQTVNGKYGYISENGFEYFNDK